MRTFAQKPTATQQAASVKSTIPGRANFGQNRKVNSILRLQRTIGNQALQRLLDSDAEELQVGSSTSEKSGTAHDFSRIPISNQKPAAPIQASRAVKSPIDILSEEGEVPEGTYIDQEVAPTTPAPDAEAAPAGPAQPTSLLQLLTGWAPGADQYGFQLKFRCRSTSGKVQDLQNQAPNLIWREHVSYTRNDFSRRINPPDPTILPPDGVSFAPASTSQLGPNLLEFSTATDTHWMPTSAIRSGDFQPAGAPPPAGFVGPLLPPLPAVMESHQLYQFSQDGGGTWQYFAGGFIIRRTLFDDGGTLKFRTQKTGVHTTEEPYKP